MAAEIFSAPGRVNLIGEHTDYTGGFVLPMAIDFQTRASAHTADDPNLLEVTSVNFAESAKYRFSEFPEHGRRHWSDYPVGVIAMLRRRGIPVSGLRLEIEGDVPLGAGLSSSASVEVATALAVLSLTGISLSPTEIPTLCQAAENEFAGGACGIMDQFAVANARAGHALLLDCRSLNFELLKLPEDASIVVCNSMVKHTVAHGIYGDRRGEVEHGQAALASHLPHVSSLRDATVADLESVREFMTAESYARCHHIITENGRVMLAKRALLAGDLQEFGRLMYQAHASFRDDFAASCEEVDALVELARDIQGCFGARITGGGFGGCTVNLVVREHAEAFREKLVAAYRNKTGILAECYITSAADGALARNASCS